MVIFSPPGAAARAPQRFLAGPADFAGLFTPR
jgi:hypothetical protein